MADVINIDEQRPHLTGEARCVACGHTWVAVAPVGTKELECPECLTEKGLYRYNVVPNGKIWECDCGCDLFFVLPTGFQCYQCGTEQRF